MALGLEKPEEGENMTIKIYTADNCETCKATIAWMEEQGVNYEIVLLKKLLT